MSMCESLDVVRQQSLEGNKKMTSDAHKINYHHIDVRRLRSFGYMDDEGVKRLPGPRETNFARKMQNFLGCR